MGQDCKYCGAYISGRAEKCPACGKRINYKAEDTAYSRKNAPDEQEERRAYTYENEAEGSKAEEERESGSRRVEVDEDVKRNRNISFLCYFGILFLIPYLMRPQSDFVKFHSNQGLVLLIASVVGGALAGFVPLLDGLADLAVEILILIGFVKGLINVYRGEKKELPIIGGIKILK